MYIILFGLNSSDFTYLPISGVSAKAEGKNDKVLVYGILANSPLKEAILCLANFSLSFAVNALPKVFAP